MPGAYFVTVCTHAGEPIFGEVRGAAVHLSAYGELAAGTWFSLPRHYLEVHLDAFIVMPDHVHAVIWIREVVGAGLKPAPTGSHSLSEVVRAFKTFSARRINAMRGTAGQPVWQRNYYERVIRNDRELLLVREYILNNPQKWHLDRLNPAAVGRV